MTNTRTLTRSFAAVMLAIFGLCFFQADMADARDRNDRNSRRGGPSFSFGLNIGTPFFHFDNRFRNRGRDRWGRERDRGRGRGRGFTKVICNDTVKERRRGTFVVTICEECTFGNRGRNGWSYYGAGNRRGQRCVEVSRERRRIR